jgi:hypothetical protein
MWRNTEFFDMEDLNWQHDMRHDDWQNAELGVPYRTSSGSGILPKTQNSWKHQSLLEIRKKMPTVIFPELIFSEVEFLEKHFIFPEVEFRVFEFWGNISNRS